MEGAQMKSYKRIAIFGPPGAGKTTWALKLSQQLGLPCYHLDKYFFEEDWVPKDKEEFRKILDSFAEKEQWIIDGNAISSLESRFARADLIIYYAPSRLRCIFGIFKRTYFDCRSHIDDRAPNCPERITISLFKYMWRFNARIMPIIHCLKQQYTSVEFKIAKTPANLLKFF